MKRIWIIGLFLLFANVLLANSTPIGETRGHGSSILTASNSHNRPQWSDLGMEDLLVSGEESSVSTPPVQTRLANRSQTGHCSSNGPINDNHGHFAEPYKTVLQQTPLCLAKRYKRHIDYFVYFISVLRL